MEINRNYLLMGAGLVTILGLGSLAFNHIAGAAIASVGGLSYIGIAVAPYVKKKWEERNVKVLTEQSQIQSSPLTSVVNHEQEYDDWEFRRG